MGIPALYPKKVGVKKMESQEVTFYSKVISKPNSINEEIRDGFRVLKRTHVCTFINGVLTTSDPDIIKKLRSRPDMFRTDRAWINRDWRITEEGKKLLAEGVRLGLDIRHIRKEYLVKLIAEDKKKPVKKSEAIEQNSNLVYRKKKLVSSTPKPQVAPKIDYKELMKIAKGKGIKSKKRADIELALAGK